MLWLKQPLCFCSELKNQLALTYIAYNVEGCNVLQFMDAGYSLHGIWHYQERI